MYLVFPGARSALFTIQRCKSVHYLVHKILCINAIKHFLIVLFSELTIEFFLNSICLCGRENYRAKALDR